jgi:hypothetical protein
MEELEHRLEQARKRQEELARRFVYQPTEHKLDLEAVDQRIQQRKKEIAQYKRRQQMREKNLD